MRHQIETLTPHYIDMSTISYLQYSLYAVTTIFSVHSDYLRMDSNFPSTFQYPGKQYIRTIHNTLPRRRSLMSNITQKSAPSAKSATCTSTSAFPGL